MHNTNRISRKELSDRDDIILGVAAYGPIFALMLQCLGYEVWGQLGAIHMMALIISAIPAIVSMFVWIKRKFVYAVAVYMAWIAIFAVHFLVFPENREGYWAGTTDLLVLCLPCFINVSLIRNTKIHLRIMMYVGGLTFIAGEAVLVYRLFIGVTQVSDYNMSYSGYMLFPATVLLYCFTKEHKISHLLISLLCFVSMVILGSRGAVVAWLVYFVIAVLLSHYNKIIKTGVFFISTMFVVEYEQIIRLAYNLSHTAGINSRTLELLVRGELLTHDSGRNALRTKAIEAIMQHPIVGNGIGAEYRLLGTYSHNIALDILLHYGIIFGVIVLLAILMICLLKFVRAKDKMFYLMFFCYGAIPLLVSGSYLTSMPLWILLGYCVSRESDATGLLHIKINSIIDLTKGETV